MQHVLRSELWKTLQGQARRAYSRKAAIAYVTQDLLGFLKGDTLLVNASSNSVSNGENDAKLLRKLNEKGVNLYDCPGLHTKVVLLDDLAIISSGNMSNSSANGLVEAGVITDHSSTVAGVASFIEQLLPQPNKLNSKRLAELCKIKVVRRGGWPQGVSKERKPKIKRLGNRTWLVGLQEIVKEPPLEELKPIDQPMSVLRSNLNDPELEPNWIRWAGNSRFRKGCREGDSLIQIWRSSKAKRPSRVFRSSPVLLKQTTRKWTRFYPVDPNGPHAEMPWGRFQRLLREIGYSKRVGPGSTQLLDPEVADAIQRKWKGAAKS